MRTGARDPSTQLDLSHTSKGMTGLGAGICPLLYIYIARELLI